MTGEDQAPMYFEHVCGVLLGETLVTGYVTSSRLAGLSQASALCHDDSSLAIILLHANTTQRALMFTSLYTATIATPSFSLPKCVINEAGAAETG